ncbi:MAG: hypothetical protein Q8Q11_00285 [bacterium]|nr:hypothetical protein [bacterium]
MSEFHGYEIMTNSVTDTTVRRGSFYISKDNAFRYIPKWNRGKGYFAATGFVQPVLQVPFFATGLAIDKLTHSGRTYRVFFTRLYSPFVTALAAVCIFFLMLWARKSVRWATAISLLFAVASLAWPYSKIGMEPTLMLAVLGALLSAWKAGRSKDYRLWALTGLLIGLALGTKPYGLLPALGVLPLLVPILRKSDNRTRLKLIASLFLPIVAFAVMYLWYNWYRTGSPLSTGYPSPPYSLTSIFNFLGALFSPGKGLIWYSPLVVLGALGFPRLWRSQKPLAVSLLTIFLLGAIPASSGWWGDEGWGPRYLVPVAWVFIIPIAWWVNSLNRKRILLFITCAAIFVQLLGVLFRYDQYFIAMKSGGLTGEKVYDGRRGTVSNYPSYGWDPVRWIPEVSPLLFNAEAFYSKGHRLLGRGDRTVYYAPFGGHVGSYNFSRTAFPDLWWINPTNRMTEVLPPKHTIYKNPSAITALLFLLLSASSFYGIFRLLQGTKKGTRSTRKAGA